MKARTLVIQHEDACSPGLFADWLEAEGVGLDVVNGHRGDPIPASLDDHDGLIVLGGERGAYDDADWGWLPATRRLIAHASTSGKPFLGICLGHQLAAVALGGVVVRNPAGHAKGLTQIGLTEAARDDLLFGDVGATSTAVQWNQDVVADLPPGAVLLATAPDGSVQAVRFGPRSWGVQFHPEATPAIFRSWTVERPTPIAIENVDPVQAAEQIDAAADLLERTWQPLAQRFAATVLSESNARSRVATS